MATFDPDYYLRERYLGERAGFSRRLGAYYAIKPLLPRAAQMAMRRLYARRQAGQEFPRWPIEPILVEHQRAELRRQIHEAGGEAMPFLHYWPDAMRAAVVLTHDVEGPAGIKRIPQIRDMERRHGFVSAWYFVAEDYPIPDGLFDSLKDDGCEVGLHGIHHDGKLFTDRNAFESNLPAIHRYLKAWDVVGFRSPATHRNADWMPELGCLYDSSFSDSSPFEPQRGGCCSILPYFLDELVELPMTLLMDHTLWEVLREDSPRMWIDKARWVIDNNGLVNLLVHPDYVNTAERAACYERFLAFLASEAGLWHTLPRTVAGWWRERACLERNPDTAAVQVDGGQLRPTIAHARVVNDELRLELPAGA
jgi:peptidoglycan/xylan/chitin deacetylase (PgdA/CDA1 family)